MKEKLREVNGRESEDMPVPNFLCRHARCRVFGAEGGKRNRFDSHTNVPMWKARSCVSHSAVKY